MDPRQEILNQQRRRHQNLLRQEERDKRQTRSTYYAGQDTNGQPLVRAAGGAAVPMRSLSNIQPDIGQQGRSDGRRFDVGTRRSSILGQRRKRPLDIVWGFKLQGQNTFSLYSRTLGLKTYQDLDATNAVIYRPFANSSAEDFEVLVSVFDPATTNAKAIYLIKKLNILTGNSVTVLTLYGGFNGFVSSLGVNLAGNISLVPLYPNYVRGHLYPSFINPPYPYQRGTAISGNTISLDFSGITATGPSVWNGSWTISDALEHRLRGFDNNGNFVFTDNRVWGRVAGQDFDLLFGDVSLYEYQAQWVFSPLGDLNLLTYPYEIINLLPSRKFLTISRLINLNGFLSVGQMKKVKIPEIMSGGYFLWVDVSPLDLFNTGRGLTP